MFYASPQQPAVPDPVRAEVAELGRILGYMPHHMSRPDFIPADVPDKGLTPSALLSTYNANRLAADGFTGKGTTIVFFAFDGFEQADLDLFASTYGLPQFTPTVVGGQPAPPRGETTMDLEVAHAIAPDARKVVINARPTVEGDGAFEKIGQMFEDGRSAVPRRGVELLDRLGLRQTAHRSRPGAGAVGTGDGARRTAPRRSTPAATSPAWSARAATTGRPRRAPPTSGWIRSRRCPR